MNETYQRPLTIPFGLQILGPGMLCVRVMNVFTDHRQRMRGQLRGGDPDQGPRSVLPRNANARLSCWINLLIVLSMKCLTYGLLYASFQMFGPHHLVC